MLTSKKIILLCITCILSSLQAHAESTRASRNGRGTTGLLAIESRVNPIVGEWDAGADKCIMTFRYQINEKSGLGPNYNDLQIKMRTMINGRIKDHVLPVGPIRTDVATTYREGQWQQDKYVLADKFRNRLCSNFTPEVDDRTRPESLSNKLFNFITRGSNVDTPAANGRRKQHTQ